MAFNLTAILELPAVTPPAGIYSTFKEDPAGTQSIAILIGTCFPIALLAFAIRMYTKLRIMRKFELADYVLVLAQCAFIAYTGTVLQASSHGIYHLWDIRIKNVSFFLYWFRIVEALYGVTATLIKVALLIQFIHLFAPTRKGLMYWTCLVNIWVFVAWGIALTLVVIFQCTPIRKTWDPFLLVSKEGHCVHMYTAIAFSGGFQLLQDLIIILLPQPTIWKLQLPRNKKIGISALFGVGILACVVAIVRLVTSIKLIHEVDKSILLNWVGIWAYVEVTCGIVVASLPVSPRFVQHLRDLQLGSAIRTYVAPAHVFWTRQTTRISSKIRSSSSDGSSASSHDKMEHAIMIEHHESKDGPSIWPQGKVYYGIMQARRVDIESQRMRPQRITITRTLRWPRREMNVLPL